jgi:hypothetical protein
MANFLDQVQIVLDSWNVVVSGFWDTAYRVTGLRTSGIRAIGVYPTTLYCRRLFEDVQELHVSHTRRSINFFSFSAP